MVCNSCGIMAIDRDDPTSAADPPDAHPPATDPPVNGDLAHRFGRAVERLVGADLQRGEGRLVFIFFANLFLLLTAYYILKVIREPLILLGGGAVHRSYARGLQALLLFVTIPAYSILANRVEPTRLVKGIMGFFLVCLAAFYLLGRLGVPLGFAFFVWLGIFSTLAIAQFWSLATDLLTEAEGKRLFPLVAAGGTIGGIVGSQIAARAASFLDPYGLMVIAAALIFACLGLLHLTHREGQRHRQLLPVNGKRIARDKRGGFTLILHDRYLLLIAVAVVLLNLINTTGDFVLARMVNAHAQTLPPGTDPARFIASFYGNFQTYITVLTAIIQIFVVARIFKKVGIGAALFILPVIAVSGYGAAAAVPFLAVIATVKVIENSGDYSLQNTIGQALFLRTSRDAKYKAKAAVDTVFVRVGDLASTGLVFVGMQVGLSALGFVLANVVAGIGWLLVVAALARRYREGESLAVSGLPESGRLRPAVNQTLSSSVHP